MSAILTVINSNGSKWAGESPDTLDQLYAVLQSEPLDPTFEKFGDFALRDAPEFPDAIRFWGNFFTVSHVFSIDTNDPDVIATIDCLNQGQ